MYKIVITKLAERDIEIAFQWWSENRSPAQAVKWYGSILSTIETLREMPDRCPYASEADKLKLPVRQLLFGVSKRPTHRILFELVNDEVRVLRVRNAAQDALTDPRQFG